MGDPVPMFVSNNGYYYTKRMLSRDVTRVEQVAPINKFCHPQTCSTLLVKNNLVNCRHMGIIQVMAKTQDIQRIQRGA